MAEPSTFIKLDRNIQKWRWYQDANTMRVFVDLLLNANVADKDFLGITVHRGELATSYASIAGRLNLTIRNVRTAISHLKMTGEVTVTKCSKFQVITVLNYDRYQTNRQGNRQDSCHSSDIQVTFNRQQYKNIKNNKNNKNINKGGTAAKFNQDGFAKFLEQGDERE